MAVKVPAFEKKEIEIREIYVDENNRIQERIKKVGFPTGKIIKNEEKHEEET